MASRYLFSNCPLYHFEPGYMIKILLLVISILTVANSVSCQELGEIKGKIVDGNNRPLPYATIRLKNISIGVISNQSGDFRLPLKSQFSQDTLIVSYIGYSTKKLPIVQLKPELSNIIILRESSTSLAELEIHSKRRKRLSAKKIVAAAISNISINYPMNPFTYVAYYRDYQIKNNTYTNMNEAIVRVLDNGFETNDQVDTQLELMQYRVNQTFPMDSLSSMPYDNREKKFIPQAILGSFGGNELAILRVHDALRNYNHYSYSFVDNFSEDFISNHIFRLSKVVSLDAIELYQIKISSAPTSGDSHFSEGTIYIEKQNYKVHKMEYSMYNKSDKVKLLYNIKVEYANTDGKMYLNYISFNNEFQMRNPDDFRILDTRIASNFYCFFVTFSHPPDQVTATNKNNYSFTIKGKKVELDTIMFLSDRDRERNEMIAVITNPLQYGTYANAKTAVQMTADYGNIKDTRSRTVNEMTFIQATQYRELFVQKIQPQREPDVAVVEMDKFAPISSAKVTTNIANFGDYWMNTPLKRELEDR
jgi:hypothetical protein